MIHKYRFLLILGLFFLLSFYFFSRGVKNGFLKQVDFDTTVRLQERIDTSSRLRLSAFVGNVLEGSTFLASPEVSIAIVGFLTIVALYVREKKRLNWKALIIPLLFVLLVAGEIYGKNVVHHPAPPYFLIKNPTTVFPKYYVNEEFSYPSGHTARAVFIGIVLYLLLTTRYALRTRKQRIGILLLAFGILSYITLVSISRIYLGHHWLSDVIGGGLLGGGLGLLTAMINSRIITEQ